MLTSVGDWLHPWTGEARIVAALRARALLRDRLHASIAAGALLGLVALLVTRPASATQLATHGLVALGAWPLPSAMLLTTLGYFVGRARLFALAEALRAGWWAAAPVPPRATPRTLLAMALLGVATTWLALAVLLWLIARLAAMPGGFVGAWLTCGTGATLGITLALLASLRHRARPPGQALREGVRRPLFSLRGLDTPDLPHLLDWQRREGMRRWRRGGGARAIGAVILLTPAASSPVAIIGVLLLVASAAWWGVAASAATACAHDARCALAATPLPRRRLAAAAVRYPLFASACATLQLAIAAALLGWSALAPIGWLLVALPMSARAWPACLNLLRWNRDDRVA